MTDGWMDERAGQDLSSQDAGDHWRRLVRFQEAPNRLGRIVMLLQDSGKAGTNFHLNCNKQYTILGAYPS